MDAQAEKPKASIFRQAWANISSLVAKRVIKGSLAYLIVFILFFINPFRSQFSRPLILQNLILPTIVLPPTVSIGAFLDAFIIFMAALGVGGALFALVGGALASSNTAQGIVLFIATYVLSLVRSNMRYFGFGLLTVLLMFQGLVASTNLAGHFDRTQLVDSMRALAIGSAISLFLDITLFPENAESQLQGALLQSLNRMHAYGGLVIKTYLLEATEEDEASRVRTAVAMRGDLRRLKMLLGQCEHEITYSRYPLKTYAELVRSVNYLQTSIVSVGSSLFGKTDAMKNSKAFRELFLPLAKDSLIELREGIQEAIEIVTNNLTKNPSRPAAASPKAVPKPTVVPGSQPSPYTSNASDKDLEKGDSEVADEEVIRNQCNLRLRTKMHDFEAKQHDLFVQLFAHEDAYYKDLGEGDGAEGEYQESDNEILGTRNIPRSAFQSVEMDDAIGLLNVYAFNFVLHEFVEELLKLQTKVIEEVNKSVADGGKKHLHFNLTSYVPNFAKFWKRVQRGNRKEQRRAPAPDADMQMPDESAYPSGANTPSGTQTPRTETEGPNTPAPTQVGSSPPDAFHMTKEEAKKFIRSHHKNHQHENFSIRRFLAGMEHFFKGPESIYALKVAMAAEILAIVLFAVPDGRQFFQKYNVQSGVVTLLVAITPTLGQGLISFVLQILAGVIGSVWALISLYAWRNLGGFAFNPYGLTFFLAIITFPSVLFQQKYPQYFVVGLLVLLNASGVIVVEYGTAGPPRAPQYIEPYLRWARALSSTLIALGIAQAFNLSPLGKHTARSQLRYEVSAIFHGMNKYYSMFITLTNRLSMLSQEENEEVLGLLANEMRRREMKLAARINNLSPLIGYSATEPRLAGPFPKKTYDELQIRLTIILDRLMNARLAIGTKGFGTEVAETLVLPMMELRKELQTQLRSTLYMFGTAMATKTPLPEVIPGKVTDRDLLMRAVVRLARADVKKRGALFSSDGFIHFYCYALNMRSISFLLDECEVLIRDLYGSLA